MVELTLVQITAQHVRDAAVFEHGLGRLEVETARAVAKIEDDTLFAQLMVNGQEVTLAIDQPVGEAGAAMRQNIALSEQVEHVVEAGWRKAHMNHQRQTSALRDSPSPLDAS